MIIGFMIYRLVQVKLHSELSLFRQFFLFDEKDMRFFIRIFISPYPHQVDCYILIHILFKNFVYER